MSHKKRPDLIPVLDNQAIFGAYMNQNWPQKRSSEQSSIYDVYTIEQALNWIATDLIRPENTSAWLQLQRIEPSRTLLQTFDSVWWMYFRSIEPVS
jgi:hypothetical protein